MPLLHLPGLIDCHVHFREPGYEHKATMMTESAAARAGGVLTVCEMPNTHPPTVTIAALADKVRRAEACDIDIRFFFGATEMSHLSTLRELFTGSSAELKRLRSRCCGLKLYLDHSTGNQKAGADVLEEAFKLCAELEIPVVCHCEDSQMNAEAAAKNTRTDVAAHSVIRSPESEAKSVEYAIGLARKFGTHLHVAHLSTAQGIDLVAAAKKEGLRVTCEVAPHHLFLTVDDYDTLGTLAKMNPPLRTYEHRDALWRGIKDGIVDCVATDHAPHTLKEKRVADPLKAPSGVPGVETMVPLLLSVAAGHWPHPNGYELRVAGSEKSPSSKPATRNPKLSIQDITRLCFTNPNRIFHLGKRAPMEGSMEGGIFVDPDAEWTIRAAELHSKCGWTPFEGWRVKGKVMKVLP